MRCDTVLGSVTKCGTKDTECGTITCSITACRLMLSQTLTLCQLICPDRWRAAQSLKTILAVDFKFWNITAECVVDFFVLGCYVLYQLINLQWVHRILCRADCGKLNSWAPCLVAFFGVQRKAALSSFTIAAWNLFTLLQWLVIHWGFCFYKCNQPHWTTYSTCRWTLFWHFSAKLHTKSPLHCKHWFRLVILEHTLCFLH
jgi:hypothetical protein